MRMRIENAEHTSFEALEVFCRENKEEHDARDQV